MQRHVTGSPRQIDGSETEARLGRRLEFGNETARIAEMGSKYPTESRESVSLRISGLEVVGNLREKRKLFPHKIIVFTHASVQ